ncbi:MAG TPA: hypothetical protein VE863_07780 [Pyrinomonadaceae bacterium]|nr:hypothetical protein [Pyrinomonadaceae bacterium]
MQLVLWRIIYVVVSTVTFLSFAVCASGADNTLYSLTNNSPFNIYTINTATGVATSVGNLSFASAGISRQPGTGLIYYYAINASSGRYSVATWDPSSGTNTTLSGTVNVYLPRIAFKSDGTLYGMDSNNVLYTLNTTTGAIATTIGTVTGGGLATGLGGDIAFSPTGTLYVVAGTNLYSISGTSSTLVGATGISTALAGLAFATDGSLYTSDTNGTNSGIWKLNTSTGAGTLVGSSGAALSDLGALPAFADMQMTKTATSGLQVGQNATYNLSVKNNGPQSASGTITVTDTLPTGLSYVSGSGTGWSCNAAGSTVTCTNAGPVASGVTMNAITLTVSVASGAVPSVTNSASVASTTFDNVAANNSGSVTKSVMNLVLSKAVSPTGSQIPGTDLTYSVTFTNSGGAAASSFVISDAVPANTDFKVGSAGTSLGTTGLTVAIAYSNNSGSTWTYTPASGGGGASAGYDRNVTNVRWTFTGNLSQTSPNNTGTVSFIAKIR